MCSMHYKRWARSEKMLSDSEPQTVECVVCGTSVERHQGTRKHGNVCSYTCRHALKSGEPFACAIPGEHWALWMNKSSDWPRFGWVDCRWCGTEFPSSRTNSTTCSKQCESAADYKRQQEVRGYVSHSEALKIVRYCETCRNSYRSPYVLSIYCSDECRPDTGYGGWISKADRYAIYERDGYTCWLCAEPIDMSDGPSENWAPSLDHVIPRSRGGSDDPENLRTAHRYCNSVRSDSDPLERFPGALV